MHTSHETLWSQGRVLLSFLNDAIISNFPLDYFSKSDKWGREGGSGGRWLPSFATEWTRRTDESSSTQRRYMWRGKTLFFDASRKRVEWIGPIIDESPQIWLWTTTLRVIEQVGSPCKSSDISHSPKYAERHVKRNEYWFSQTLSLAIRRQWEIDIYISFSTSVHKTYLK